MAKRPCQHLKNINNNSNKISKLYNNNLNNKIINFLNVLAVVSKKKKKFLDIQTQKQIQKKKKNINTIPKKSRKSTFVLMSLYPANVSRWIPLLWITNLSLLANTTQDATKTSNFNHKSKMLQVTVVHPSQTNCDSTAWSLATNNYSNFNQPQPKKYLVNPFSNQPFRSNLKTLYLSISPIG